MSVVTEVKAHMRPKKKRRKSRPQADIRYEPYPEIIIRPSQAPKEPEDVEEGEIIEEKEANVSSTNLNSTSATNAARQAFIRQIAQLELINEPCPTFSLTGSCTSICPRIHDKTKTSICCAFLQQSPCANWKRGSCNLAHDWNFQVAPSCISYLLGICYNNPCRFAHNDHVCALSAHCEQFKSTGRCEVGAACNKIHLVGDLPQDIVERQHQQRVRRLEEAKRRAKLACLAKKSQVVQVPSEAKPTSTPNGTAFLARKGPSGASWSEEVEEVLGGMSKGELALQKDFVPFG